MAEGSLNVIALVSGGKDSFFSILHCLANGHHVVALANLYPSPPPVGGGANGNTSAASTTTTPRNPPGSAPSQQHGPPPGAGPSNHLEGASEEDEADLNSFMYQTVGHQVVPLYAEATGLPLFRQPIVGTAVHHGLSYDYQQQDHQQHPRDRRPDETAAVTDTTSLPSRASASPQQSGFTSKTPRDHARDARETGEGEGGEDETESLVPLLRAVLRAHPEANALSTGAILSTYQRTRVESVALRLGLAPLSYLWQFPTLPLPLPPAAAAAINTTNENANANNDDDGSPAVARSTEQVSLSRGQEQGQGSPLHRHYQPHDDADHDDDAQLLRDMAAAGLEARIVKVASAGLDEGFLWENVADAGTVRRVQRALRRFGGGGRGAVLGEGGEFETLVVDGPPSLFKGRIVLRDDDGGEGEGGSSSGSRRRVVREGGGNAWLNIRGAAVEMKADLSSRTSDGKESSSGAGVRVPGLLDPRFEVCLAALRDGDDAAAAADRLEEHGADEEKRVPCSQVRLPPLQRESQQLDLPQHWCLIGNGSDSSSQAQANVEDQATHLVNDIRRRLVEQALPASAITNAIIVLRHMSDFPTTNKLYGSLFPDPNPPARVTISCGDLLPAGCSIAIYLTVQPRLAAADRRGLHVQSRSYWAPANIGPYSQAIAVPLILSHSLPPPPSHDDASSDDGDNQTTHHADADLAVSIAGQIPLIPASMSLPPDNDDDNNLPLQVVLALQHLWRVGAETHVRWWTSAAAYFPRAASPSDARRTALLAAAAWRSAHLLWPPASSDSDSDEDEDEDGGIGGGPDLWDRRYNPQYRSWGGDAEADAARPLLPDWEVLKDLAVDENESEGKTESVAEAPDAQCRRRVLEFLWGLIA